MDFEKLIRPQLLKLPKTVHGGQAWRLQGVEDYSQNLNPFGPPDDIDDIIRRASSDIGHYPDDCSADLKNTISKRFDVPIEDIIIGSGSSDIIRMFPNTFIKNGDDVIIQRPSFAEYAQQCTIAGGNVKFNELSGDFRIDFESLKEKSKKTKAVYICNPNNPTGVIEKRDDILNFVSYCNDNDTLVFMDETLLELVPEYNELSCARFVDEYDNLVVASSLTKSFAIPGIRIGFGFGSPKIIELMNRVRMTWNVGTIEQNVAKILIDEKMEHVRKAAEVMRTESRWMYEQLRSIGFPAIMTDSHFFFNSVEPLGMKGSEFVNRMLMNKIMVRDCASFGSPYERYVRFCVKDRIRNERFIDAVKRSME